MNSQQRDALIAKLPVITEADISTMPNARGPKTRFVGKLGDGESVVFEPLAWKRAETPRLLSIHAEISRAVNIQRFFGIFHDSLSETSYAVMEELGEDASFVLLKDALSNNLIDKASYLQKLRLCYEIALAVAYLHSVHIVVKVISEKSIFIKEFKGEFVPAIANLEYARLVTLPNVLTHASRQCQIRTISLMTLVMILLNITPNQRGKVLFIHITLICGGQKSTESN